MYSNAITTVSPNYANETLLGGGWVQGGWVVVSGVKGAAGVAGVVVVVWGMR